jgi:formylglycine-generating enzyme required for sulfatase activity
VSEWTSSLYEPYPYAAEDGREADIGDGDRVVRGGSWGNYNVGLRAAGRDRYVPEYGLNKLGFRCARSEGATQIINTPTTTPTSVPLADALAIGSAFSGGNADWQAQYPGGLQSSFDDGVAMVQVPAGCFTMGMTDAEIAYLITQNPDRADVLRGLGPQHQQCFEAPFWIDRTEVTQGDFARLSGLQAERSWFSGADRPVQPITWFEARDFCALRGARLPTEAEWEYAARGPDSLVYPWGNAFDEDNAVWYDNSGGQTAPVGSRPAGRSWVGADDMSGNVWEWTSSLYEPYPYAAGDGREADTGDGVRVVRGGSWNDDYDDYLRAALRSRNYPENWYNYFGFRCARSEGATPITPTPTITPTSVPLADALAIGSAFSGGNADWRAQYPDGMQYTFDDGVPMVQVPAGCFMMGSNDGDGDERPQHQQCFSAPFWIDRTEVTQADFTRLGGVQAEQSYFAGADRPVEQITWFEARDFCALRGARLPTEAEWEYAARGPHGLAYPWGNAWNEDNAVWGGNSGGQTAPVGSRPAGRSWVGADDMIGNVWEWTSSLYEPYPYAAGDGREADTGTSTDVRRVVRGGSWFNYDAGSLRAAYRGWAVPGGWVGYNFGFRCARSEGATQIINTPTTTLTPTITPTSVPLADALAIGSAFSGGNADWQAQVPDGMQYTFDDGVAMVQVPPGCFTMGMTDAEIDDLINQYGSAEFFREFGPQQQQCFSAPFWIDRTEVTQADFARLGGEQERQSRFSGADRPVEQITWFEARDFCALRGARLPTEAEWEYAARGPDSLVYPWGNAWNEDNAVWDGNSGGQTAPVGSRPAGRSWVGADDMSGNVWEWTSSLYEPYPYAAGDGREADTGTSTDVLRVVRGGSWNYFLTVNLRAALRGRNLPENGFNDYGFRCARSS